MHCITCENGRLLIGKNLKGRSCGLLIVGTDTSTRRSPGYPYIALHELDVCLDFWPAIFVDTKAVGLSNLRYKVTEGRRCVCCAQSLLVNVT